MSKRVISFLILAAFLVLSLAGCSSRAPGGSFDYSSSTAEAAPQAPEEQVSDKNGGVRESSEDSKADGTDAGSGVSLSSDPNRKLIRTGEMEIESLAFDASLLELKSLLSRFSGYIESSSITGISKTSRGGEQLRSATLTVRVPSKVFDAFLDSSGTVGNIIRQATYGEDVTESYYDTEARLASRRIMEQRLLELLSKSEKLTDIISLEQSLADTRYEIERLTGTLRKWDALIEYSTVTVYIREVVQLSETEPLTPDPKTLGEKIAASFKASVKGVKNGLSALIVFTAAALPYIVVWGVILALIWVIAWKLGRKNEPVFHGLFRRKRNKDQLERRKKPDDENGDGENKG